MLEITVPALEAWDELNNQFITTKEQTLRLEHSLVSLSKWESKWKKPFLTNKELTVAESVDYVRCMTLTQNVDPNVYRAITNENMAAVKAYIDDPYTATTFSKQEKNTINREQITAELVYYWMIALNIDIKCEKWHLNRLLTLIRVCNIKNQPSKKQSRGEIMRHNAALNRARRKKHNTKG